MPDSSQQNPVRVAAMYKLFLGEEWLLESVASVIEELEWLCFCVSDRAWSDDSIPGNTEEILQTLHQLAEQYPAKVFIKCGSWSSQLKHVQDGLEFVQSSCPLATHLLYIDSDEIYPEGQLPQLISYAADVRYQQCALHISWYTFFKTINYRVDPIEPFRPLALFPLLDGVKMNGIRSTSLEIQEVPVRILHFSYVRKSDERIAQKLASFKDDEPVMDGWFENVWLNSWPGMRDFHPVNPREYHALAYVPDEQLRASLASYYRSWLSKPAMCQKPPPMFRARAPGLAFVIVTHNSAAVLERCLRHVQTTPHEAVIVVDNASTDATLEIAQSHQVEIIALDQNRGFGPAANIGASISHCELLCFLNPDCFIDADTVKDAKAVIAGIPGACVAPKLKQGAQVISSKQAGYSRKKLIADMLETNQHHEDIQAKLRSEPDYDETQWSWMIGACLFIQRAAFNAVDGFDERYFLYMEDVDFGERLCRAGFQLIGLNRVVQHQLQGGASVAPEWRKAQLNQARLLYAEHKFSRQFRCQLEACIDSEPSTALLQ